MWGLEAVFGRPEQFECLSDLSGFVLYLLFICLFFFLVCCARLSVP